MGKTASVSFKDSEMDLWNWVEDQYKNGPFRSRSGVILYCVRKVMMEKGDDEVLT